MMSRYLTFFALVLLAGAPSLPADPAPNRDWPQIRGPERNGRSPETGLLKEWDEGGPRLVWRRAIGEGFSGLSVVDGRLLTGELRGESEFLLALDARTGEELWRQPIGPLFTDSFGNGPRSTPTIDEGVVYILSSSGRLAAFRFDDGAPLWQVELTEAFDSEVPRFGFSASALIEGDLLLIEVGGGDGRALVGLDKATGELRWSVLDGPAAYSSPVVAEIGGVRQLIFFRRSSPQIVSLLPDGEVYWTHEGLTAVIHMPLLVPPDGLYISSTHAAEGFLLRVRTEDGKPRVEEAWRSTRMKNHFNASVVIDGHIYGFDNAIFKSLDAATGEPNWARRGYGKGSLIEAEGHLIVLSDGGEVGLVEASPERYVEKGRFQAMTGKAWTAPTLAGGRLYLRDQDEMVSFDLKTIASRATASRVTASRVTASSVTAPSPTAPSPTAPSPTAPGATADRTALPADRAVPADTARLTAEVVLSRYAEARGGLEKWRAIDALEMSGTFTSFSLREPFTRLVKRPSLYRFETVMNGERKVHARDASGPWFIEPDVGAMWARRPAPGFARQLDRAGVLEPALLGAEGKGHRVKLAGRGEINGMATLELEVQLANGDKEIWHLDPSSYLEVAIDARVLDYTQARDPISERAYFADFREVSGLMIPHRIEREYLSRHTVLEVERLAVDPQLEDARFAIPPPEGMAALVTLAGAWRVTLETRPREGQPWQETATTALITPRLDGGLLEERLDLDPPSGPIRIVRQWTWDRFREIYRVSQIDDTTQHLKIFEGDLRDGTLILSNETTATAIRFGATEILERFTVSDLGARGFKMEGARSSDGGASWTTTSRATYQRE